MNLKENLKLLPIFVLAKHILFNMKTQFVTDNKGKKVAVLISIKEYQKILEDLDEINCIKAYDKAKSRNSEFIEASIMFKSIERKKKRS